MLPWSKLVRMSDEELAPISLAEKNLACADELAGAPTEAEIAECLKRVEKYALTVKRYTERNIAKFRTNPEEFYHSEAYFRVLGLVSALWLHCGVRYNKAKAPEDVPLETEDVFIHGALLADGGTCSSLPVVYAAVGRRLGYPIVLAHTRTQRVGHLFARWEGSGSEKLNIDVNETGLISQPDDVYRMEPFYVTPDIEEVGGFIKTMTPKEELAVFLTTRAFKWIDQRCYRRAIEALAWVMILVPDRQIHLNTFRQKMEEWEELLKVRKPKVFPALEIEFEKRRYPETLPRLVEKQILKMEATENILCIPELETRWWKPLREGHSVPDAPKVAIVKFAPEEWTVCLR